METMGVLGEASKLLEQLNGKGKIGAVKGQKMKKYPVGFKREVSAYAMQFGVGQATEKYQASESNIYNWLKHYRQGRFDNLPPDQTTVARRDRKETTSEIIKLRATIAEQERVIRLLIDKLK